MAGLFSGLMNNYSEMDIKALYDKYSKYLMEKEEIATGFKLVRDTFIVTDKRIILIDHQGVTGKKTRVASIHLDAIYDVTIETGGTGFDDSEMTVYYITSPYYRSNHLTVGSYKFEFGKHFNLQPFYVTLLTVAHENLKRINHFD